MRHAFVHFASVVWVVHAVFGSAFHHTHPGAEFCSATPGECRHACHVHDHKQPHAHAHPHANGGTHHDGQCAAVPDKSPVESPDHSCPGHHNGHDGSTGFVKIGAPHLLDLLADSAAAPTGVVLTDAPSSFCQEHTAALRGPPLRCHLVLHVLLI